MKKHLIFLFFTLFPCIIYSQNIPKNPNKTDKKGLRQGNWTIVYNKDWKETKDKDSIMYYRLINYKDDKPVGATKDFFKSGKLQMEAILLADRPEEVMHGLAIWYDENNLKTMEKLYFKGELRGEKFFIKKNGEDIINYNTRIANKEIPLSIQNVKAGKYEEGILVMEFYEQGILEDLKNNEKGLLNYYNLRLECYLTLKNDTKAQIMKQNIQSLEKNITKKKTKQNWEVFYESGLTEYDASNYKNALDKFEKAKNLVEKEFGKENKIYAKIINSLSVTYSAMGNYHIAYNLALETKNLDEKIYTKDSLNYGLACANLAHIASKMEKYPEAEKLYFEALNIIQKKGKNTEIYANTLNNLGLLYNHQGNFTKALSLCQEAKHIREKVWGKKHVYYAESCNNVGSIFAMQRNPPMAFAHYQEAKEIYANTLGKEHLYYATICNNIAEYCDDVNLNFDAINLYKESLEIMEKKKQQESPNYAFTCFNLALVYKKMNLYQECEKYFLMTKNIYEKIWGKNNLNYANICGNLADFYATQIQKDPKKFVQAKDLFLENQKIYENLIKRDFWHLSEKEKNYYLSLFSVGFDSFKEFAVQNAEKNNEILGEMYNHLLFSKAILFNTSHKIKQSILNGKDEALKKMFVEWQTKKENLLKYYTLSVQELKEQGINISEKENETNTLEKLLSEKSQKFMSARQQKKYFWKDIKNALKKNEVAIEITNIPKIQKKYEFDFMGKGYKILEQENDFPIITDISPNSPAQKAKLGVFDKILEINGESTKGVKIDKILKMTQNERYEVKFFSKIHNKEVITTLKTDSVFKEKNYLVNQYVALIITPQQTYPQMVLLDNGNKMEKEYFEFYLQHITNQQEDDQSYQRYWEKIQQALPPTTQKAYIALDGVYNKINLNSLLNQKTNKYLLDELDVQILSNTKELITKKNTKSILKNATLAGYPDYNQKKQPLKKEDNNPEQDKNRELLKNIKKQRFFDEQQEISELEGTKAEIANLEKILKSKNINTQIFLYENATEQNIKNLSSPQILHLATHGFFLENIPNTTTENNQNEPSKENQPQSVDDNRNLKQKKENNKIFGIDTKKVIENPLLRSGLLFAGAKNAISHGGDGVLTAYEAMNLDLDDTEAVILSACQTGMGTVQDGEGVYGLQRAFQTAGAKTIIMSLWSVSDEATLMLMTLFYENWISKKQTKKEAFKNAQLELRIKYPEPYFWGAFVMVGE